MKKARMNISHSRFILSKLKIFGEIVTTYILSQKAFKVARVSGATLNAYQHALKPSLTSEKLPLPNMSLN